ncbi:HAMP domain-containing sensor histidine kinase [Haliea sp. E17]|uniref:sensor histidine kinase n=1 Tax=Haliea sp. E17 TaxID=3401576 RepID=UPI003AAFB819
MSFWQPKSVLQLVLLGFFAAVAPLCIAIFFTVHTLGELANNHREVTRVTVSVSRLGQEIQRDVLELERRARQYMAIANTELADLFEKERESLSSEILELQALQGKLPSVSPDLEGLGILLERLKFDSEAGVSSDLLSIESESSMQRIDQTFVLINERSNAIRTWLQASVDRLLEANATASEELIEYLFLQLSTLAAATLALLLFFSYWISRPIRSLIQEIQQLGSEGLGHSIEITGPVELRELGSKLEWLRQELHATEQQKQKFLRHVSHELKTPLASLREGTDLLSEQVIGHLSQRQREIVDIVKANGNELQRLIENLIDFNRVPLQQLSLEEVQLETLIDEIVQQYRLTIDNKELLLNSTGSAFTWVADRYRLRTALDNLLSNAVNYTPEGGRIELVREIRNANLVIEVANSGERIPTADVDRVFEPFFQSAAKRTGPIKGSGIGLSVARECMEALGGSLSVVYHRHLPVCFRLICPAI